MGFDRESEPWLGKEKASSKVTKSAKKLTRDISVLEDVKRASPSVGGLTSLRFPEEERNRVARVASSV
jgi:indole-3-glycerol phosphate synthase